MAHQTKHTPGPWNHSALAPGYIVADADDYETVCAMAEYNEQGGIETKFKNAEVNGRLIAAAPDLLEACQAIKWLIENGKNLFGERAFGWLMEQPTFGKIEAAIAKAVGHD